MTSEGNRNAQKVSTGEENTAQNRAINDNPAYFSTRKISQRQNPKSFRRIRLPSVSANAPIGADVLLT